MLTVGQWWKTESSQCRGQRRQTKKERKNQRSLHYKVQVREVSCKETIVTVYFSRDTGAHLRE